MPLLSRLFGFMPEFRIYKFVYCDYEVRYDERKKVFFQWHDSDGDA